MHMDWFSKTGVSVVRGALTESRVLFVQSLCFSRSSFYMAYFCMLHSEEVSSSV